MRKKLLVAFIATITALCSVLGFTACNFAKPTPDGGNAGNGENGGQNEQQPIHTHEYGNLIMGYDTHYKVCSICGEKAEEADHTGEETCADCGCPIQPTEGLLFALNKDETGYVWYGVEEGATCEVIKIPSIYNGLPVTNVGELDLENNNAHNIELNKEVKVVLIPDSVTSIAWLNRNYGFLLESIAVANDNANFHTYGNCIIETASKTLAIGCKNSVIPIDGSVTSIGLGAFSGCGTLTNINIPDSVTSIGVGAFGYCISLTNINIPDNVTSIDDGAFNGCMSLTSIDIPDGVTSIGEYAFNGCYSLTSIELPDSVTSIGGHAFDWCMSLTSIEIPDSVTSIDSHAFADCMSLTIYCEAASKPSDWGEYWKSNCPVVWDCKTNDKDENGYAYAVIDGIRYSLKDGVATVVGQSFSIKEAKIPVSVSYNGKNYSVTSINSSAFISCRSLTSIEIPDSVTNIGMYAFADCKSLTIYCEAASKPSGWDSDWNDNCCPVVWNYKTNDKDENGYAYAVIDGIRYSLKDGIATVVRQSFSIKEAKIPASVSYKGKNYSVTSIGTEAFRECTSLKSITIPEGVTSIGDGAFNDCYSLEFNEYNNAEYLGNKNNKYLVLVKAKNSGITSCTINVNTKVICDYAFYNCSSLTSIEIPNSVTSIDRGAFSGCSKLTNIVIPDSVTSIGGYAFSNCSSLTSIEIPDSVTNIGMHAFSGCSSLTSIEIPDSVTNIGMYAFFGCSKLTSIKIPDGVKSIGDGALGGCSSLKSIEIPDSVTSIGSEAFWGCSSLNAVYISDLTSWCKIDFNGGSSNPLVYAQNLYLNGELATQLVIPNSVTSIGRYAFYNCSALTSIEIPDSVTSIGERAFHYCSSLIRIDFKGTKEQWKSIKKSSGWNTATGEYTVYCTDGTLSKAES